MSEQRLYIRVRGRVTGPFTLHQLRTLRDRGQFRRFHEISPDRLRWTSAASLTDLFAPEPNAPMTFPELEDATPVQPAAESQATAAVWHYVDAGGNPQGPVPRNQLLGLWQQGKVSPTTLVWREGMSDWREITAPETGLGLTAPRSPLGLPLPVWIALLAALAVIALAVLCFAVYKWGEHLADTAGTWGEDRAPALARAYHTKSGGLFDVAAHGSGGGVLAGGERIGVGSNGPG